MATVAPSRPPATHAEIRARVLRDHPGLAARREQPRASAASDPLALRGGALREHPLWSRYGPHTLPAAIVGEARNEQSEAGVTDNGHAILHGHSEGEPEAQWSDDSQDALTHQGAEAEADDGTAHSAWASKALGPAYSAVEQTFRPDHSWNFVASDLTQLPANAVRNRQLATRFEEYPRLRRLLECKRQLLDSTACPPTYLGADLRHSLAPPPPPALHGRGDFHLATLIPVKYDVVLIDAPLSCYDWNSVPSSSNLESEQVWSWQDISELPISLLAAKESFVFLWVGPGSCDGLERGRETLTRWGYRRCEVITWCITNPEGPTSGSAQPSRVAGQGGALAASAVHCLVGIRGTVRRSKDANFVHCNVDTDVIFWEGEASTATSAPRQGTGNNTEFGLPGQTPAAIDLRLKPPELYTIIENFCQGTRRVELFGTNRNLRRGWLTIGLPSTLGPQAPRWDEVLRGETASAWVGTSDPGTTSWHPEEYRKGRYDSYFKIDPIGCALSERANVVPTSDAIEGLRPRTPPTQILRNGEGARAGRPTPDFGATQHPTSFPRADVGTWDVDTNTTPGTRRIDSLPRGLGVSHYQQRPRVHQDDRGISSTGRGNGTRMGPTGAAFASSRQMSPVDARAARPPLVRTNTSGGGDPDGRGDNSSSASSSSAHPYRSSTAGLGAGGPVTVSVQSGSETLSGPQRSAIGLGLCATPAVGANAQRLGASAVQRGGGGGPRRQGRGGARGRGGASATARVSHNNQPRDSTGLPSQ